MCVKKLVILTGFHKYKTIIKSLTNLEIEITDMMKRQQHITKLQSELIQEKKLIHCKLDEAIAKYCYLKKSKYEILPQVVTPNIPSHMKSRKLDNILNTIQYTVPMTPPNTLYKATLHNIITKTPLSTTPRSKFPTISKQEVIYNFHNEIDDAELLKVDLTNCANYEKQTQCNRTYVILMYQAMFSITE